MNHARGRSAHPYAGAVPSTLGFALLGLLARRPRTGYELSQAMKEPVGYFWSAGHSQIYPELARLEESGLIRGKAEHGPGPRQNRRYTISAAGRRALAAWAAEAAPPEPARNEELLKLYSLWLVDPSRARETLAGQREQHLSMLAQYESLAQRFDEGEDEDDESSPGRFFDIASVRRGITGERAIVKWFDELLVQLDER
jgi:DNA-binding PadR family transcriptional regulator